MGSRCGKFRGYSGLRVRTGAKLCLVNAQETELDGDGGTGLK